MAQDSLIKLQGCLDTMAKKTEGAASTEEQVIDGVKATVTKKRVSAWDIAGGDGGFALFNPNASVVYPGSLLQGASLGNATPDVISCKRGGGTISIDIKNGSGSTSVALKEITKSSV